MTRVKSLSFDEIPLIETYPAQTPPPMTDLLSDDPEQKKAAKLYWVTHTLQGFANSAMLIMLKHLPPAAVSTFGARLSGPTRQRFRDRIFARRIQANMAALLRYRRAKSEPSEKPPRLSACKPPADAVLTQEEEESLCHWWANVGRTTAEFCVVNRLYKEGHLKISGLENLRAAQATGRPLVFVSVHLATWELLIAALHLGETGPVTGPFQPEPNRFANRVVYNQRAARNQYLFPPGQKSAFRLRRLFQSEAASLLFFIDEVYDRQIHFPLFGRRLPRGGNTHAAIKLANTVSALLVPAYMKRVDGPNFELVFEPHLPQDEGTAYEIPDTIKALNEVFEPIVLDNLEHWYMLAEVRN